MPLERCSWTIDDVGGDGVWETSCRREFAFDGSDGPDDAGFTTCPYCGKPLTEVRTSGQPPAVV